MQQLKKGTSKSQKSIKVVDIWFFPMQTSTEGVITHARALSASSASVSKMLSIQEACQKLQNALQHNRQIAKTKAKKASGESLVLKPPFVHQLVQEEEEENMV